MEKIQIFDQNHGLTPLQKFEFCHFLKRHFYVTEYQTIFLGLFSPNTKYEKKIQIFDQNHCKNVNFSTF